MKISIVLPCLNESETLVKCIKKATNQIRKLKIKGETLSQIMVALMDQLKLQKN